MAPQPADPEDASGLARAPAARARGRPGRRREVPGLRLLHAAVSRTWPPVHPCCSSFPAHTNASAGTDRPRRCPSPAPAAAGHEPAHQGAVAGGCAHGGAALHHIRLEPAAPAGPDHGVSPTLAGRRLPACRLSCWNNAWLAGLAGRVVTGVCQLPFAATTGLNFLVP